MVKKLKGLEKPITQRKFKKSKQLTVVIKQKETPIILNEPNVFFKSLNEDEDMGLFFRK